MNKLYKIVETTLFLAMIALSVFSISYLYDHSILGTIFWSVVGIISLIALFKKEGVHNELP